MFNKLVTGSLTAALVFGGALTTADASADSDHSTKPLYQNHLSFATNGDDRATPFANQLTHLHSNSSHIQGAGNQASDDESFQQEETDRHEDQKPGKPANQNNADQPDVHIDQNTSDEHQGDAGKPRHNSKQPEQPNTDDQPHNQSGQQGTDGQQSNQSGHQGTDDQQQDNHEQKPQDQQSGQTEDQSQQSENSAEQKTAHDQGRQQVSAFEQQVVELTNEERTSRGLEPLEIDTALGNVARKKSNDMASNNYFSHDSPNYGSPFDMIKESGISYQTAGENIARGQKTPEAVVDGWMNSEGHRENILNAEFTHIGVGYTEDGDYWTQEFIGK